jgi:hypothetical protein
MLNFAAEFKPNETKDETNSKLLVVAQLKIQKIVRR